MNGADTANPGLQSAKLACKSGGSGLGRCAAWISPHHDDKPWVALIPGFEPVQRRTGMATNEIFYIRPGCGAQQLHGELIRRQGPDPRVLGRQRCSRISGAGSGCRPGWRGGRRRSSRCNCTRRRRRRGRRAGAGDRTCRCGGWSTGNGTRGGDSRCCGGFRRGSGGVGCRGPCVCLRRRSI